ncbi:molybdenum cofactor guanylyltransferase [Erythrobacter sp. JK5]|uniref:molybdenum cofactor guanylyltransferase n=1 Tax=Erythrobacter sp. JK5 TaxID=2829500 RepID=UPI001BADFE3F|nr:molybdenum cofactor guanylyltransferase [Erythrobacter sp. JK5]QUL37407.1 molybdenum cofactor guanylyltransferase [Erythrobacter sp. JK5]
MPRASPQKASNRGVRLNILGAILAGGQARRFGSDKAHALIDGVRLIDRVADALGSQTTALIVCGRDEPGFGCIPDLPAPGLGPLGGLNAALDFAETHGFTHVLTAGVDCPNLPADLAAQLAGEGAAIIEDQPVVGLWPVAIAADLVEFLAEGGRALYGFADRIEARRIAVEPPLINVNSPGDLPG